MRNVELHGGYRIPFAVPHAPENEHGIAWPNLKDPFQMNVLLGQLYFTRAYTLGSSDARTLMTKSQLENSEAELRKSGEYPFQLSGPHSRLNERLDAVVEQSFNFLDKELHENYNVLSRKAKDAATAYTNRLSPTWHQFCSPVSNERTQAFSELNKPDKDLISKVIEVFSLRADYMRKKAGSVGEYFMRKDGIDWTALLSNRGLIETIEQFGNLYSKKRAKHLGVDIYKPQDMYARSNGDHSATIQEDIGAKDSKTTIRNFLASIGLDEVAQKLIFVQSQRTGGYLIHLGHKWDPRPLVFLSDSSGRRQGSAKYDVMSAHEAGHAAAHFVGSRASLPLFSINGTISEFPSILLETLFKSPENMKQVGYSEAAISEAANSVPSMHHHLKSTELEYRLLEHAENGTLDEETLGIESAHNLSKYYGVVHDSGEQNHTWQFLMSRQMLHDPWFNMRSYVVGDALAHATIKKLKADARGNWIGSESFRMNFSALFNRLFRNGPFTLLRDIEKEISVNTEDVVMNKLNSDFELSRVLLES